MINFFTKIKMTSITLKLWFLKIIKIWTFWTLFKSLNNKNCTIFNSALKFYLSNYIHYLSIDTTFLNSYWVFNGIKGFLMVGINGCWKIFVLKELYVLLNPIAWLFRN